MANGRYRHVKTGGYYLHLFIAIEEATLTPLVIYQSEQDGKVWARPQDEFFDGRFIQAEKAQEEE